MPRAECSFLASSLLSPIAEQVYDITSRSSFAALQSWVKELKEYGPEGVVICVCGNKADFESSRVSLTEGH